MYLRNDTFCMIYGVDMHRRERSIVSQMSWREPKSFGKRIKKWRDTSDTGII